MNQETKQAMAGVQQGQITATIIRADGRVEELGVVAYHHKNPIKRWAYNAVNKIRLTVKIALINRSIKKEQQK